MERRQSAAYAAAAELGPLIAMALLGGALADRMDRRRLLLVAQIGLVLAAQTPP